jgi:hypothetical protein
LLAAAASLNPVYEIIPFQQYLNRWIVVNDGRFIADEYYKSLRRESRGEVDLGNNSLRFLVVCSLVG